MHVRLTCTLSPSHRAGRSPGSVIWLRIENRGKKTEHVYAASQSCFDLMLPAAAKRMFGRRPQDPVPKLAFPIGPVLTLKPGHWIDLPTEVSRYFRLKHAIDSVGTFDCQIVYDDMLPNMYLARDPSYIRSTAGRIPGPIIRIAVNWSGQAWIVK